MAKRRHFGEGRLQELPQITASITRNGHVVFVSGQRFYEQSGASSIIERCFPVEDRDVFIVSSTLPTAADYDAFWRTHSRDEVGCLVAVGGGHIIDTAKLISTASGNGQALERLVLANSDIMRRIPLVAVPTTMGSGSEETPFAVIYIGDEKYSVDHPSIIPDAAIVDPSLMRTLDGYQIAVSGLDAIAQSIEAMLSCRATKRSDRYARRALTLGWSTLPALVRHRTLTGYRRMALAANLAGRAIAITRTTIPHALSYFFTQRYGVPHGLAVSLSMGRYLRLFGEQIETRASADLGRWREPYAFVLSVLGCRDLSEVGSRWLSYVQDLGVPHRMELLGIEQEQATEVQHYVNFDRFSNSPITVALGEIASLFT